MLISQEGHLVTLINVFETSPEQQQALIEQWTRFADTVKEEPGFIGAALHKSIDGTRVVNYAQWRSEADYERFVQKSSAQFATLSTFAAQVDPHTYDVISLYEQREG